LGVGPVVTLVAAVVDIELSALCAPAVVIQQLAFALGEKWAFLGSVVVTFVLAVVIFVHATAEVASARVILPRPIVSVVPGPAVHPIVIVVVGFVSIMIALGLIVVLGTIWVVPIFIAVVFAGVMFVLGTMVIIARALIVVVAGIGASFFAVPFVE